MIIDLRNNWFMNFKEYRGISAKVPMSLYSVLLKNNLIKDPYYGLNEYEIREISREDAEFVSYFESSKVQLTKEHILLRFSCVDTIADIYLNGTKVGYTDNMFVEWEFNVKDDIREGKNELKVLIHSPVEYGEKGQNAYHLWGLAPSMTMSGYQHIRKAHCMFGWDWGPQLPDMGIYRDVSLVAYDGAVLKDFHVSQEHNKDGSVILIIKGEFSDGNSHNSTVKVEAPDGLIFGGSMENGICEIKIDKPMLWWPNGYGEQNLYKVTVEMEETDSSKECSIGIRTLTVSTALDKWGSEFCFVINGNKIFSMGADYIPEDNLIPRISFERTEELIKACVKANFNTIRVWGGGNYPDDSFYDLCDQYGLLVWQDFMFACATYNLTDEFEKSLIKEFEHNLKRFRNHPCLGLLCGNNEMEMAWLEWGIPNNEKIKQDYIYLYERLLPRMVKKYAPQTFYWPASPSSRGGFEEPNSYDHGDAHYWDVWHHNKPFEEYRKYYFRYCSEFGFEAFPAMKTLETIGGKKDFNPFSRVMESHQKCEGGNKKILNYLADYYLYPGNFEMFIYASQLLQADAIKYGVEHFRRFRGRCMGALYWQLNDIWPGPSWSSVDYYGRWKALHYYARSFFAPVLLSAHLEDEKVVFNVSNERMVGFEGKIRAGIRDNNFNTLKEWEFVCGLTSLEARDIATVVLSDLNKEEKYGTYLYYQLYDNENRLISSKSTLFVKPKHFMFEKPKITIMPNQQNNSIILEVSADKYACSVRLEFGDYDVVLSENFFDLISREPKYIEVQKQNGCDFPEVSALMKNLSVVSVYDIANMPINFLES